jgi:hypothetical protein
MCQNGPEQTQQDPYTETAHSITSSARAGLGLCAIVGQLVAQAADYPFRIMWFTPVIGGAMVLLVSLVAAAMSARPVLKLEPAVVFAGR